MPHTLFFDAQFPLHEQLPRRFDVMMTTLVEGSLLKMRAFVQGRQFGDDLTDNSHIADGYRFHDVFHFSCAGCLAWSPVVRRNLRCKRKTEIRTDEVEDGGRAIVTEEAISLHVFHYARARSMLERATSIDRRLLKQVKTMADPYEVRIRTCADWERTILRSYAAWRRVLVYQGGIISVDLIERTVAFKSPLPLLYAPGSILPKLPREAI